MESHQILNLLEKYDISQDNLNKLIKHISFYKEIIEVVDIPKFFDDKCFLMIYVCYTFDNQKYEVSFGSDEPGIWSCIEDYEYEGNNDLKFILHNAICQFLNKHHPYPYC